MAYSVPNTNVLDNIILCDLDASTANEVHTPGYTVRTKDGREFMFVKYECSGVAAISGAPAIFSGDLSTYVVTSDTSDGDAEGGAFAGIFCSDQADQNGIYLWIQTKGRAPDAHCEDAVAAGDLLYCGQADCFDAIEDAFDSTKNTLFRAVAIAQETSSSCKADIILL